MPLSLENRPEPPYYAVIFTSLRSSSDSDEYSQLARRMVELTSQQPGYLGMTSFRNPDGLGVTISYWADWAAIANWRTHAEHRLAQKQGREKLYEEFRIEVCRVEDHSAYKRAPND